MTLKANSGGHMTAQCLSIEGTRLVPNYNIEHSVSERQPEALNS